MTGILVTGTRGKSTLVRLLHRSFLACGLRCHARITGVIPRLLGPDGGETPILRIGGGHVSEMRWWLKSLPADAGTVILENSAVALELQPLAGKWLRPKAVAITNLLADHFEAWGPTARHAARALLAGIPDKTTVIAPEELLARDDVKAVLKAGGCRAVAAVPPAGPPFTGISGCNLALALTVCDHFGLDREKAQKAMRGLEADLADFRVISLNGAELAFGFSANDPESTLSLFHSLGWPPDQTDLLYNHRRDRPARLKEFAGKIFSMGWRRCLVMGDRPRPLPMGTTYLKVSGPTDIREHFGSGRLVFGCGNVKGIPLAFLAED